MYYLKIIKGFYNIELSLEHIYLKKLIISLVPIRVYTIAKKVKKYIKTMS